jgi:exopolysaccharide biosynthesis WecB/TagA/CpsF family protein
VAVSVVDYERAVSYVMHRARLRAGTAVSALAVHGLMTGVLDPRHRQRLNGFDMLTPDGQPVRWALNLLGRAALEERVYGPELMERLCAAAQESGARIYLFGSTEKVVATLEKELVTRFPGLAIVGAQPHRFREATQQEDADDVERINRSGANIVFVGLGCPRQEVWAHEHRDRVHAVLVCVGAAFDFLAGLKRQAPKCMQRRGLEWLFRLATEPRRLWRRYLLLNPVFLILLLAQWSGVWRPSTGTSSAPP